MVKYVKTDMSEKVDSWKSVVLRWLEYARDDPDVVFVGADSFWAYLDRFDPKLKDWFYSDSDHMRQIVRCGIAEASMITVASGLADQGLKVYCQTMGWLFERAYNMIAASVCIDRHNVTMVARAGGIGGGPTHQNTRLTALYRPLPNLICMAAADAVEAVKMAEFAYKYNGPVFFAATPWNPTPLIYEENYPFKVGQASLVREGDDVSIIACQEWVLKGLQAAEKLAKDGIDARVINMSTLKPMDSAAISKAANETGAIVTAETQCVYGGLGEAVARVAAENCPVPMRVLALPDLFTQADVSGKGVMATYYHQTVDDLVGKVKEVVQLK